MAKLSSKGLIVVALGLSLVMAVLVYSYLKGVATQATKPGLPVVVAKVDIPAKTKVTADMLISVSIPPEYIQPGAMDNIPNVVGIVTRERIVAGEQVTQRRLAIDGKPVSFTGLIPNDRRALTVPVTEVTGVAGFVKVGDYVDVVHTFGGPPEVGGGMARTVLQNILVLAVDRETAAGINESASKDKKDVAKTTMTVTLAVTPDEAAQITLADEKGKIRLALRPETPNPVTVETRSTIPVSQMDPLPTISGQNVGGGGGGSAPAPRAGVQTIRGTKVQNVPVE